MPTEGQQLREYNVVVVGGGGAGKSDLSNTFIRGHFMEGNDPTIQDTLMRKVVVDDEVALIGVLDTSGQEEYGAMRERYMRTGEGFILVYSITSRESFQEIDELHKQILQVKKQDSFPMVIVGNKCHLEYERQVSMNEGREVAKRLECGFLEISAKHPTTIDEAFYWMIRKIRKYDKEREDARASEELAAAEKTHRKPGNPLAQILAKFRLKPKAKE